MRPVGCAAGALARPWLVALLLAAGAQSASAEELRWRLEVEGGSEYDTNIHRFEVSGDSADRTDIRASPLLRGGARLRLDWRPARTRRASLLAFTGAKLYATERGQDENVAIIAGDGRYQWRLPGRSAALAVRGSYYDTVQYDVGAHEPMVVPRHFAMAGGELMLTVLGPDHHRLIASSGYRRFRYKPSEVYNWHGEHYSLAYRTTFWRGDPDLDLDAASIDVTVSYRLERRNYRGDAFTSICSDTEAPRPACFRAMGIGRTDLHHGAAAEIVYTGDRIYSARYELEVTDSNSVGQSLVRHRLELGLTTEIFAGVFATARAALQLDTYPDSLLLARDVNAQDFTTIDEDSRNTLSLHIARDITDRWSLEGRYALFTNEFAARELSFRRHVIYLGVQGAVSSF